MLCCTCYSTEIEYRTVAFAAAGVTWIHSSLHELEVNIPTTLVIYCDNPIFHSRMKHIAIDFTLFVIKYKVMLLACLMFHPLINLLMSQPNLFRYNIFNNFESRPAFLMRTILRGMIRKLLDFTLHNLRDIANNCFILSCLLEVL